MVVNDLRRLHARALENAKNKGPLAEIRRASLLAAVEAFPELTPSAVSAADFQIYLADETSQDHAVSVNDASDLLRRIQRAVARLAKARRSRVADVARLSSEDFAAARFNVAWAAFGSLTVDIAPDESTFGDGDETLPLTGPSWAEVGMVELIRALPESEGDDRSIDSLMGASPVVRRAVSDLVTGLNSGVRIGLRMTRGGGEVLRSHLSPDQTREISRRLGAAKLERQIVHMRGRLDGVRTRRQIFYFETKAGNEIHGFVDESLMPVVKEFIDREVDVSLEVVIERSHSGKTGQRHYRLISVEGQQSEIPEASAQDEAQF
jgi:hypothetical protein